MKTHHNNKSSYVLCECTEGDTTFLISMTLELDGFLRGVIIYFKHDGIDERVNTALSLIERL